MEAKDEAFDQKEKSPRSLERYSRYSRVHEWTERLLQRSKNHKINVKYYVITHILLLSNLILYITVRIPINLEPHK